MNALKSESFTDKIGTICCVQFIMNVSECCTVKWQIVYSVTETNEYNIFEEQYTVVQYCQVVECTYYY